ncbi:MAG: hypothetical protein WAO08_37990 [Hyphomicrobiaceae bacterium]
MSHTRSRLSKKRRPGRAVTTSTAGTAVVEHDPSLGEPLSHEALNRVLSLKKVAEILGCHEDTVRHHFAEHIERVGKRRIGLRYKFVIAARPAPRPAERSAA